jgi:hypothetical protein
VDEVTQATPSADAGTLVRLVPPGVIGSKTSTRTLGEVMARRQGGRSKRRAMIHDC